MKCYQIAFIAFMTFGVYSNAVAENTNFNQLVTHLQASATADNYEQITNAIKASALLTREFNELADAGKFKGFTVARKSEIHDGRVGLFGGFINDSKIVLTSEFLEELKKDRTYDVVYDDDILPNNTVFVLAHLAYHLKEPVDMSKYSSPMAYGAARIQNEASAFIQAWNAMLETAKEKNGKKSLSPQQVSQLLMNARYRFVFSGAISQASPLKFSDADGSLAMDRNNIQAIAQTLEKASIADVE